MAIPVLPRLLQILERHRHELCPSHYTRDDLTPTSHCLLAWMAIEAGIPLPPARFNTHVLGMRGTRRFANQLSAEYGLTIAQLKLLQFANDDAGTAQEMEDRVLAAVRGESHRVEIAA